MLDAIATAARAARASHALLGLLALAFAFGAADARAQKPVLEKDELKLLTPLFGSRRWGLPIALAVLRK